MNKYILQKKTYCIEKLFIKTYLCSNKLTNKNLSLCNKKETLTFM